MEKVARTSVSVPVVGESGTGKELVAQQIHQQSRRSKGPFKALNCGAISSQLIESELFGHEKGSLTGAIKQHKGTFEQADGGTLFLDEVTEMPMDLQVRLLRVLETGAFSRVGSTDLQQYHWPGNVRERRNLIQRGAVIAEAGVIDSIPSIDGGVEAWSGNGAEEPRLLLTIGTSIAEAEKKTMLATLKACDGARDQAAELLGISPKTLYNRLKSYDDRV